MRFPRFRGEQYDEWTLSVTVVGLGLAAFATFGCGYNLEGDSEKVGMLEEAVVQVPFKFTFTSESVDGDGCGGESEPYFRNVRINGILVADNSDLPDCDDDTTCSLDRSFTVQVPDTQPTVTVHAEMWEDDSGSTCGDDDHEFTMDLVLDRITGVLISGTMSNPSQGDSGTIAPGATCATINGWGFCWSTSGTVEPPVQRVLFVPTCWNPFDQIAFDAAVDRWTRFFSDNSAIARCDHPDDPLGEKFEFLRGPHVCPAGGNTPDKVLAALPLVDGVERSDIDVLVSVVPSLGPTVGGFATGLGNGLISLATGGLAPWAPGEYMTFAHEYGHAWLSLGEEYRVPTPNTTEENWPNKVTEALQGCDPATCCNLPHEDPVYNGRICPGNRALALEGWNFGDAAPGLSGGRCIMSNMSAAGWDAGDDTTGVGSTRSWCTACWNQWTSFGPKCTDVFAGRFRHFDASGSIGPDASINLTISSVAEGRLGPTPPTSGEVVIQALDTAGNLLGQAAVDPHLSDFHHPDADGRTSFWLRFPVADGVDLPLVLKSIPRSGTGTQVTAGGSPPFSAVDNVLVECQSEGGATVMLDATASTDPDGDTIFFDWTASVPLEDETSATPSGFFPLGTSQVSVTARDGQAAGASASAFVTVEDTTAPIITLAPNAPQFVCSLTGDAVAFVTPTAVDACAGSLTVTGQVVASSNPSLSLPLPLTGGAGTLPVGEHTIEWTSVDPSGNAASASQVVHVLPALYATERLDVRDRAELRLGSGFAAAASSGSLLTRYGADARSAELWSVAGVELADRVRVEGQVRSSSTVTLGNQVVVTGGILQNQTNLLPPAPPVDVVYPPASGNLLLEPNEHVLASPGAYGTFRVKQGAVLSLPAGTFYVDDLLIETGGTVIASEATLLFVKTQVIYRGTVTGLEMATFTYTGSLPFVIDAPFSTHLRAPNAEVVVRRDFTGQIVARVITVDAGWKVFCN